ncbi:MAG: alkaline phosphatase D family protein [Verrucomicrobiota bacterium]
MKKSLSILVTPLLLSLIGYAQPKLLNGPMPTSSTMNEVIIWTQTTEPASVQIEYWLKDQSETTKHLSSSYQTTKADAYVAKVAIDENLQPGARYDYRVLVNGTPQELSYRSEYKADEPIPMSFQVKPRWRFIPNGEARHSVFDFRIAAGSCAYINEPGYDREGGRPYGDKYHIFESIHEKQPDLMFWLGDTVYYRENDFESRSGMIHRWTHDRSIPHLRPLLASAHHFATWDDHDYGPNDIGSSYHLKGAATEIFNLFWGNPSAGLPDTPGIFTYLNWGDVNFYLLDNRYHLTTAVSKPHAFGKPKSMLGQEQVDWLVDHLSWAQSQMLHDGKSYPARFNIICLGNQVLSEDPNPHNYRNFPEEWNYLIDRIVEEGIDGVIFLTGDVHHGEVNRLEYIGGGKPSETGKAGKKGERYLFHEITSSPLTSGSWAGPAENDARYDIFDEEDIDRVGQRNFVTLDFKGPLENRRLEIRYFDSDGKLLNRKADGAEDEITEKSILYANDLKAPR